MSSKQLAEVLEATVQSLSEEGDDALSQAAREGFPDRGAVVVWTDRLSNLLLQQRTRAALRSELPALAERLQRILKGVLAADQGDPEEWVARFVARLPAVRRFLAEDVNAAFEGDPAAKSYVEIVVAVPSLQALAVYRAAHELFQLGVPLIPRIMTEHAHSQTGIDIHPGARIGRRFFIDHGTGVVIGETSEIGHCVRIYQGVTLGALSPRQGQSIRGQKRHPTIEDHVTIYPGATILGGETVIGRDSVIGGNAWLTESVPPGSRVVPEPPRHLIEERAPRADSEECLLQLQGEL